MAPRGSTVNAMSLLEDVGHAVCRRGPDEERGESGRIGTLREHGVVHRAEGDAPGGKHLGDALTESAQRGLRRGLRRGLAAAPRRR